MTAIFSTIRQALNSKITSELTIDGKPISKVYKSDRSKFDGYPAVIITPSDNSSDYGDSSMKSLDITFIVRAHVLIGDNGQEKADDILDVVVDELLTMFADSSVLDPACDWVFPVPSVWGYQDRESGMVRTAELKVRCRKYIGN